MKRTLAVALLACGLVTAAVPAAQAAPPCGPGIQLNCSSGAGLCRVWVGQLHRCLV
ncbi:MAG TPA: hypothetical protein VF519_07025 [Mycobacteriales bacterium]